MYELLEEWLNGAKHAFFILLYDVFKWMECVCLAGIENQNLEIVWEQPFDSRKSYQYV